MIQKLWDIVVRWRTWIVNLFAALLLVLPDLVTALMGFQWATVVPKEWMPWVTLAIVVLNVWMRPRPASRAADPDVQVRKEIAAAEGPVAVVVKEAGETKRVIHG